MSTMNQQGVCKKVFLITLGFLLLALPTKAQVSGEADTNFNTTGFNDQYTTGARLSDPNPVLKANLYVESIGDGKSIFVTSHIEPVYGTRDHDGVTPEVPNYRDLQELKTKLYLTALTADGVRDTTFNASAGDAHIEIDFSSDADYTSNTMYTAIPSSFKAASGEIGFHYLSGFVKFTPLSTQALPDKNFVALLKSGEITPTIFSPQFVDRRGATVVPIGVTSCVVPVAGANETFIFIGNTTVQGGMVIAKYDSATQALDTSFGVDIDGDGTKDGYSLSSPQTLLEGCRLDSAGRVVVSARSLRGSVPVFLRFTPAGVIDTNFGVQGLGGSLAVRNVGTFATAIDNQNRIVILEKAKNKLYRYNEDGSLDTSFGNAGSLKLYGNSPAEAKYSLTSLTTDDAGNVIVAGFKAEYSRLGALSPLEIDARRSILTFVDNITFLPRTTEHNFYTVNLESVFWGVDLDADGRLLVAAHYRERVKAGVTPENGAVLRTHYAICNNGFREHTESCDDGNSDDTDGCSADCKFTCDSPTTYYRDADHDGSGAGLGVQSCTPISGYTTTGGDCHDGDATLIENCDQVGDVTDAAGDDTEVTDVADDPLLDGVLNGGSDTNPTVTSDDGNQNQISEVTASSGGGGCALSAASAPATSQIWLLLTLFVIAVAALRVRLKSN